MSSYENVAKELELSWDDHWQQWARASEIVNSVIWDFVQAFDVQHDPIALGCKGIKFRTHVLGDYSRFAAIQ